MDESRIEYLIAIFAQEYYIGLDPKFHIGIYEVLAGCSSDYSAAEFISSQYVTVSSFFLSSFIPW